MHGLESFGDRELFSKRDVCQEGGEKEERRDQGRATAGTTAASAFPGFFFSVNFMLIENIFNKNSEAGCCGKPLMSVIMMLLPQLLGVMLSVKGGHPQRLSSIQ